MPPTLLDQAGACLVAGNYAAALEIYQTLVQQDPENAPAWDGLGLCLRATSDLDGALEAGENATRYGPASAPFWNNLGNTRAALGDDEGAVSDYQRATELRPDYGDAWANRGMTEKRLGRNDGAVASLTHAARLLTEAPAALNTLGNQLFDLAAFEAAETCFEAAVKRDPAFVNAWNNLGNTRLQLRRPDSAAAAYGRALAQDPDHGEAGNGYAQALLMAGNFEQGWPAYEARFRVAPRPSHTPSEGVAWDGQALAGKTIVLLAEQGLGDTIQFVRFAPRLKQLGARVVLKCPDSLVDLGRRFHGIDQAVSQSVAVEADFVVPLMSLPLHLGLTGPADLATSGPYLETRTDRNPNAAIRRIGLTWSGNPAHVNDRNRSLHLCHLAPLLELPGFTFESLQQGPAQTQYTSFKGARKLRRKERTFASFAQTQDAMAGLDLLISVDTSVAHLAGAMGLPCWLMLPYVADWRWGVDGGTTPWYGSFRLFRQSRRGDWRGVVGNVERALRGAN